MDAHVIAQPRCRSHTPPRGFALLEVIVAVGVLAVLLTGAARMLRVASNQQQGVARRVAALEAVQAIAEQVDNLPWDEVTAERIAQIGIPAPLAPRLPGAGVTCTVAEETDPVARRVSIELTWTAVGGRLARPVRLTTWAFPDQPAAEPSAAGDVEPNE